MPHPPGPTDRRPEPGRLPLTPDSAPAASRRSGRRAVKWSIGLLASLTVLGTAGVAMQRAGGLEPSLLAGRSAVAAAASAAASAADSATDAGAGDPSLTSDGQSLATATPGAAADAPSKTSPGTTATPRSEARTTDGTDSVIIPGSTGAEGESSSAPSSAPRWPGFPPPGLGEQPHRLLAAVTAAPSGDFTFMRRNPDGSPVGYSPCREWHVVVNLTDAPPYAYTVVRDVVAEVSARTGIVFDFDGTTDEGFTENRAAYQPTRYGDRWAPILVAWAPESRPGVAGHGGSQGVTDPTTGRTHLVTGFVALDSADSSEQTPETLRGVMLHEFGHVVGLDHVSDPTQLMAPVYQGQPGLEVGDLAGLAALGRAECTPDF